MTPDQITLVQQSFKKVPAEWAAEVFYARLFEMAPSLRPMFSSDIKGQGRKLMAMLAIAVRGLDDLEGLLPAVRELGRRHGTYGATAEHYWVVGQALVQTLGHCLGESFTSEAEEAWIEAYGVLAAAMLDAAQMKAA